MWKPAKSLTLKTVSSLALLLILSLWLPALVFGASTVEIQEQMTAAQGYMNARQWDYASHEWRSLLVKDPANLQAYLGLASVLEQSGLLNDAVETLENARNLVKSPQLDLALAGYYMKQSVNPKRYGQAAAIYRDLLAQDPENVEAYRQLKATQFHLPESEQGVVKNLLAQLGEQALTKGQKAFQEGQYQDAAKYYELVTQYQSKLKYYNDYAVALLLSGNPGRAEQILAMLKSQAESWKTYANSGLVSLAMGKAYQAAQEMEKAIGHCSDASQKARLYNNLGYVYEAGRKRTKARFAYEKAIALDPKLMKARLNLGYIYQREREFDNAVKLYKEMVDLNPLNADAWNQLGFSYELKHQPKPALSAYKKALSLNPLHKEAYYNLGTLYKKMNKLDKAAEAFKAMTDIEFQELEKVSSTKATPVPTGGKPPESKKSELFKYVDLFFSQSS